MSESEEWTFAGHAGELTARTWPRPDARYIALLCHGYGEHIGRYEHVADALVRHGAVVHGIDHVGHGRSAGERVLIADYEPVVSDFHELAARVRDPKLPTVLVGHSMGGMIAARYAQRYGHELAALVLSGPVLGRWDAASGLLTLDEIPDTPIDPDTLSRDPEVGKAYADDPLVWHGRFQRPTLEAIVACLERIRDEGPLGALPTLWVHGEDDQLVPVDATREGIEALRGVVFEEKVYPGARHEVFNETNKDEVLDDVTAFLGRALGSAAR
ncbi:alpha-beta hydrolase superfamily lysophospholipase [Pseudonocardia hierapolitana]|uniref:Alpha-beta hydrolase superfamily lysophospholipase n=1 Tax=Pseudonocardia hierapolitana TaxID=1128676 RepID=A0A561SPF4_9PSEU|nr:alpha/beta hydrolase [Pseudonocardia hierapolitana]TWF76739.1 alpha-beta hydrolase superfamily lysophospholipase [Pseudonocardia hierapolitana]